MSHLAPQAAIFSPSIVRAAASTAKDWAYVDAWLQKHHTPPSKPPSFERNPATLEALLALVAANEEADEERNRLAHLEAAALDEVRAAEAEKQVRRQQHQNPQSQAPTTGETKTTFPIIHGDLLAEDLLEAIDASLPKEGRIALDAMADVSISLSEASPTPALLAHRFVDLQGRAHETDSLLHRVTMLQSHLDDETARLSAFLEELRIGAPYQAPQDLDRENEARERALRAADAALPDLRKRVEALEKKVGGPPPLTVDEVRRDEEAYLALLATKKDLDAQVRAFAGLPPDVEAARAELENLRVRLRDATEKRDVNFEMLVERESPVKVRSSRRP
ncbi:hypothetical protein GGR50DRAFT_641900 [Xylaria sp. CBS 124048]|nr:hypothetical protein GGR50DRAFT_641900 [Xylaria sp. CBS 124048]